MSKEITQEDPLELKSMNDEQSIQSALSYLFQNEPFLGCISQRITKIMDDRVETAYMSFDEKSLNFIMGFNPIFMSNLNIKTQIWVIKHELYHLLLQHITTRHPGNKKIDKQLWNIAADLAVNSFLGSENMYKFAYMPGIKPDMPTNPEFANLIENLKSYQTLEYYLSKLQNFIKQNGTISNTGNGSEIGETVDSHESWTEVSSDVAGVLNEKLKDLVNGSLKNVKQSGQWGTIPSIMQQLMEQLIYSEINWKAILKSFIGRIPTSKRESSIRIINRKIPYLLPGFKKITTARLVFFIDQSGSMTNEDVQLALSAAFGCSKEVEIDVYNFDTEIDLSSHQVWKKGKTTNWQRTRCGGTDFECIATFLNDSKSKKKWTGAAIITDGGAPNISQTLKTKIVWLITPGGSCSTARLGDLVVNMTKEKE